MRKVLRLTLAVGFVLGMAAAPVQAAQPNCQVDILSSNGIQDSRASYQDGVASGQFFLAQPSCPQAKFKLVVLDESGQTVVGEATGKVAKGEDFVSLSAASANPDEGVCVYVEALLGRAVVDRAPSEGCVPFADDGSSPGGGKGF